MTPRAAVALIACLALLGVEPDARAEGKTPSKTVKRSGNATVGDALPGFAGWKLDGELFSLSRWRDGNKERRPLIVSIYASWCVPCRRGLPAIAKVAKAHDVDVILIAFGENEQDARALLAELKVALPSIVDPARKVAGRLGVDSELPWTAVADADGVARTLFAIEGHDFAERLDEAVTAAAKASRKRPTPAPPSKPPSPTKR